MNILYDLAVSLLIIRFTFYRYAGMFSFGIFIMAIPLLGVKILLTRYTKRDICVIVGLLSISLVAMVISGKKLPMWSALVVIGSKGIDHERLFKYLFFTYLGLFIGIFLMPLFMDIPIYTDIYRAGSGIEVRRYHFGIGHPNGLQFLGLQLFLMYLCWKREQKLKSRELMFFIGLNFACAVLSRSRTSFIVFWLALICLFILDKKKKISKGFGKFIVLIPVISASFCLTVIYLMDKGYPLLTRLDLILEHRLTFASQYIDRYPINLTGHYIYELTLNGAAEDNRALDCGYVNLLLNNGAIFFVLFICIYLLAMMRSMKEKKSRYLLLGAVYSVYFIMEGALLGFYKNIFIFLFGTALFTASKKGSRYDLCEDNRRTR